MKNLDEVQGSFDLGGEPSESHVCRECDRRFSSGKALGGHMSRTHAQGDDGRQKKRKLKILGRRDDSDEAAVCNICHRVFNSRKSLHGHMRSHPDRPWRGMDPEPKPASEARSQMNDIDRIDMIAAELLVNMRLGYYSTDSTVAGSSDESDSAGGVNSRIETDTKAKKLDSCSSSLEADGYLARVTAGDNLTAACGSTKFVIDLNVQASPEGGDSEDSFL